MSSVSSDPLAHPRQYLEGCVMDLISAGLQQLLLEHPNNPLQALEAFLRNNDPSCPQRSAKIAYKDAMFEFREVRGRAPMRQASSEGLTMGPTLPVFGGALDTVSNLTTFFASLSARKYCSVLVLVAEDREVIYANDVPLVGLNVRKQCLAHSIQFVQAPDANLLPEQFVQDTESAMVKAFIAQQNEASEATAAVQNQQQQQAPEKTQKKPQSTTKTQYETPENAIARAVANAGLSMSYMRVPLAELSSLTNTVMDELLNTLEAHRDGGTTWGNEETCVVVMSADDRDRVAHVMTVAGVYYTVRGQVEQRDKAMQELPSKIRARNAARLNVEKPREDIVARRQERDKQRASKLRAKLASCSTQDEVDEVQRVQEAREIARNERRRREDDVRQNIESTEEIRAIVKIQSTFRSHAQRRAIGGEYAQVAMGNSGSIRVTQEKELRYLKAGSYKVATKIMQRLISVHGGKTFCTLLPRKLTDHRRKLRPVYTRIRPADALDVSSEEETWQEFVVEYIPGESPYDFAINPQHVLNTVMNACTRSESDRNFVFDAITNYAAVAAVQMRAAKLIERYGRMIMVAAYVALVSSQSPSQVYSPTAVASVVVHGESPKNSSATSVMAVQPNFSQWISTSHSIVESWFDLLPTVMSTTVHSKVPYTLHGGPERMLDDRVIIHHDNPTAPWTVRVLSSKKQSMTAPSSHSSQYINKMHKRIPVYMAFDVVNGKNVREMAAVVESDAAEYTSKLWLTTSPDLVVYINDDIFHVTPRRLQYKSSALPVIDSLIDPSVANIQRAAATSSASAAASTKGSDGHHNKAIKDKVPSGRGAPKGSRSTSTRMSTSTVVSNKSAAPKAKKKLHVLEHDNDQPSVWLGLVWSLMEERAAHEMHTYLLQHDWTMQFFRTVANKHPLEDSDSGFLHHRDARTLFKEEKRFMRMPKSLTSPSASDMTMPEKKRSTLTGARTLGGGLMPRPPGEGSKSSFQRHSSKEDSYSQQNVVPAQPEAPPVEPTVVGACEAFEDLLNKKIKDRAGKAKDAAAEADGVQMHLEASVSGTMIPWSHSRLPIIETNGELFYDAIDELYRKVVDQFKAEGPFSLTPNAAVVVGVTSKYSVVFPLLASIVYMVVVRPMDNFIAEEAIRAAEKRRLQEYRNMLKAGVVVPSAPPSVVAEGLGSTSRNGSDSGEGTDDEDEEESEDDARTVTTNALPSPVKDNLNDTTCSRRSFASATSLVRRPSLSTDIERNTSMRLSPHNRHASHRAMPPSLSDATLPCVRALLRRNPDLEPSAVFIEQLLERTGLYDMFISNIRKHRIDAETSTRLEEVRYNVLEAVRWSERYLVLILFHHYVRKHHENPNFVHTFAQYMAQHDYARETIAVIDPWGDVVVGRGGDTAAQQQQRSPMPDHVSFTHASVRWRDWGYIPVAS
eukprot:PhM_4_TR13808/c0_g1_i1/m.70659